MSMGRSDTNAWRFRVREEQETIQGATVRVRLGAGAVLTLSLDDEI